MVISIVPVRIGSKSIPKKNIKDFCGKPLIYWTLQSLQNSNSIEKIIVASDSQEINNIVKLFDFNKIEIYNRSLQNSTDISSTESVLIEVVNNFSFNKEDIIFLNQVTNPFVKCQDIDNAYKSYIDNKFDSLLTCTLSKRFYWSDDCQPLNYDFKNRPRRQDFKGNFVENGAFYINSVQNILKHSNRLSGKIGIYQMNEYSYYEIDDYQDWIICEKLFAEFVIEKKIDFSKIKLIATDVDGVLTDSGMYYSDEGEVIKKFNTRDGMAFKIIREQNLYSAIVTSENTDIVKRRSEKLKVDFVGMGKFGMGKLDFIKNICREKNINLDQVAYIGDDINCIPLLSSVGFAACPFDAHDNVKSINNISILSKKGGFGVFRSFVDYIVSQK